MKSKILPIYKNWLAMATKEQIETVDAIYSECEKNYSAGGDQVVECLNPEEVLNWLKTVEGARKYCGLKVEQASNARWGEDSDPELSTLKKFGSWKKGN